MSVAIASLARSRNSLSRSGVIASVAVATACTAAGWSWAWLLFAFFISSTLLSRVGEVEKRARAGGTVEKGGERDAWQVLANGGLFAALALASIVSPSPSLQVGAAGAIAASTADTWATEIGLLSRVTPRSVLGWNTVPAGTSGGVTIPGLLSAVAGSGSIAFLLIVLGWPGLAAAAALVGGIGGAMVDSLLGASIQGRRWCGRCNSGTERAVHTCGTVTGQSGGIAWIGNDLVNFLSSIGGALSGSLVLLL